VFYKLSFEKTKREPYQAVICSLSPLHASNIQNQQMDYTKEAIIRALNIIKQHFLLPHSSPPAPFRPNGKKPAIENLRGPERLPSPCRQGHQIGPSDKVVPLTLLYPPMGCADLGSQIVPLRDRDGRPLLCMTTGGCHSRTSDYYIPGISLIVYTHVELPFPPIFHKSLSGSVGNDNSALFERHEMCYLFAQQNPALDTN